MNNLTKIKKNITIRKKMHFTRFLLLLLNFLFMKIELINNLLLKVCFFGILIFEKVLWASSKQPSAILNNLGSININLYGSFTDI